MGLSQHPQLLSTPKEPLMERFKTYPKDLMGYSMALGRGQNVSVIPEDGENWQQPLPRGPRK